MMKRTVLFLSLVLLAAAAPPQPSPAPAPSPSPSPSPAAAPPAPKLSQVPVILIYPFDVQTGADPKIGIAIAQISAQEMAAAGGLEVPPIPQGVKRADFLDFAHAQKADFYISGYVTPVGETAAVVEQVVSVDSGVILFSQTAQVSSVADVASQSLLARTQILAFTGRETQNVETQASNTPAPTSTNGAKVPISGISSIVDSVFKHKGSRGGPSPAPTTKPSRGVIVAPVVAASALLIHGSRRCDQRALLRARSLLQRADDDDNERARTIDRNDLRDESRQHDRRRNHASRPRRAQ